MALLDNYDEIGLRGIGQNTYQQYQVYSPKSSSEYFSVMHSLPNPQTAPVNYRVKTLFFNFRILISAFFIF